MNVVINGTQREFPEETTVAAALAELEMPEQGIAVAIDGNLVPKGQWAETPLRPGGTVEVLSAVQGG
ncbi:sulfur carrier protein ThiS [Parasphingorhabdus pacifica]